MTNITESPTNDASSISCSLPADSATDQLGEWQVLVGHASKVEAIRGGRRLTLPESFADDARDLARRERTCCSFLQISEEQAGTDIRLSITSDAPGAASVIAAIVGDPS